MSSAVQAGVLREVPETLLRRLRRSDRVALACGTLLALIVLVAVFAPVIAPYNPNAINLLAPNAGVSLRHLLGTDDLGRDLLSRLIYGARTPLLGAGIIVILSTLVGTGLAVTCAWIGGRFDSIISRVLDIMFAFPGILLAIVAVAVFHPGLVAPVIALSVSYTPYIARVVRGAARRERSLPYVTALSVQGFPGVWCCVRHILPNLRSLIVAQATVSFGYAIIDLASLSFLGLGIQPPTADWGLMVAEGEPGILNGHPQESLLAGVCIALTVLALMILGDRLTWKSGS